MTRRGKKLPGVLGGGPDEGPDCKSAPGRIRTCGLLLRRQTLYPLSYGGAYAAPSGKPSLTHRILPRDPRRSRRVAAQHRRRGADRTRPRPRRTAGDGHRRASAQPRARRLCDQSRTAGGQEGRREPSRVRGLAGRRTRRCRCNRRGRGCRTRIRQSADRDSGSGRNGGQYRGGRCRLRSFGSARRAERQTRVRLGQSDRPDSHRRHPVGRGR